MIHYKLNPRKLTFVWIVFISSTVLMFTLKYIFDRSGLLVLAPAARIEIYLIAVFSAIIYVHKQWMNFLQRSYSPALLESILAAIRFAFAQIVAFTLIYFLLQDIAISRAFLILFLAIGLPLNTALIYWLPGRLQLIFKSFRADAHVIETERVLKIPFSCGDLKQMTDAALTGRGLVTAPSAPCLVLAAEDSVYAQQLASSKLIIADSGAMVLMWRLAHPNTPLKRISGLAFLTSILKDPRVAQPKALFLVDPSTEASERNRKWMHCAGIQIEPEDQYIAPMYQSDSVMDSELLEKLLERKPRYVLINLGGGIQERLGAWLQKEWQQTNEAPEMPTLLCTGAAIAFLTGEQARIPRWADRFYLGWAVRCIGEPKTYLSRYLKAIPVFYYILIDTIKKRTRQFNQRKRIIR